MGNLYTTAKPNFVYRIFDTVENKYCSSGHSLYGRGRSIWMNAGAAMNAWNNMPEEIQFRLVIKKFQLVEVIKE
jgi:hypothetical protein